MSKMTRRLTLIACDRRAASRLCAMSPSRENTHQGWGADQGLLYRWLVPADSALEVIGAAHDLRFALLSRCPAWVARAYHVRMRVF
jgi:hypothetical protein